VVTTNAIELASLRKTVGDSLGVAASPARIVLVDAVPTLSSGKPDRLTLQRLAQ
jgi:o-succinylbenzoate---CoA ligase